MANNIHPLADCKSPFIGDDTNIWQFCVIFPQTRIGNNCNICANVLMENDVTVGNNVTVKSGVQLYDGTTLEDNVCIGPNVTFTNDKSPRSKNKHFQVLATLVRHGASVGANSTILAGTEIGAYALIGAGSVVTGHVPAHALYYGNPARQKGWVTRSGTILDMDFKDKEGNIHELEE